MGDFLAAGKITQPHRTVRETDRQLRRPRTGSYLSHLRTKVIPNGRIQANEVTHTGDRLLAEYIDIPDRRVDGQRLLQNAKYLASVPAVSCYAKRRA